MASKATLRPAQVLVRRARPTCEFASTKFSHTTSIRRISASTRRQDASYDESVGERPRWSYTPEKMKAPYPVRLNDPDHWECNSDPVKLDRFYLQFLGIGGEKLLDEEVKWLAITHKSFDQGRRGFNDRLAFFGRRILNLQTSLALVNSSRPTQPKVEADMPALREPFIHPALEGLPNLTNVPISGVLTKEKLAKLASRIGMREIIRWKPKNIYNLEGSGIEVVLNTSLYAVVGALALQRGGDVAAEVAKQKILKPLGIF